MQISSPSANFTRPADTTQYAAGDLVANSTTAGSVTPMSWTLGSSSISAPITIKRARIVTDATSVTSLNFRLHLYDASPAVANGDNSAFSSTKAANYLGYLSCDGSTTPGAKFSDGAVAIGAATAGAEINVRPTSNTVYGLLEALATYTPASAEVFTVKLDLIEHFPRGA
jgi:hypothetical protein